MDSLNYQNKTLISLKRHAVEVHGNRISTTSNNSFDEHVISSKVVKMNETDEMQEPLDEFIDDENLLNKEAPLVDDIKVEETQFIIETIDYQIVNTLEPTIVAEQQYQHTSAITERRATLEESLMEDVAPSLSAETKQKETTEQSVGSVEEDEKTLGSQAKLTHKCGTCGSSFPKRKQLIEHQKEHDKKRFHCKLCKNWFPTQSRFQDHVKEKHKKSPAHKCAYCERSYKLKSSLHEHISKTHKNSQQQQKNSIALTCKICGRSFPRLDVLETHLSKHPSIVAEQQYQRTIAAVEKDKYLEENLMEDVPTSLSDETKQKEKETSEQSVGTVEEDEETVDSQAKLPYKCGECDSSFPKKKTLIEHRKEHDKKRFHCKLCKKSFSTLSRFQDHEKEKHEESEPEPEHKCSYCERSYKTKRSLRRHFSNEHKYSSLTQQQQKYYTTLTCETCGESFSRLDVLQAHMNNHEYSTAFICNVCGEMFKCQSSLDSHMKIIHRKKERFEDPTKRLKRLKRKKLQEAKKKGRHSCNLCNRKFFSLATKQNHLRRQCKECSLCFKEDRGFKEHCLRHEGKYQFHCEICNKGCVRKDNLQVHMENHSGQHSYKCATCEKSFKTLAILKNHAIEVHGRPIFQTNKKVAAQKEVEQDDVQFKYHCEICNKGFQERHQLKPHALVHSESRAHKCDACGNSYKASYSLKRHKAVAHGIPIVSKANDGAGNQYKNKADRNVKKKYHKKVIVETDDEQLEKDLNEILCDDKTDETDSDEEFVDIAQNYKRKLRKQPSRKSQKRKCNL